MENKMDNITATNKVIETVADFLDTTTQELSTKIELSLVDDLGFDDLDLIDVVIDIEDFIGHDIASEDISYIETIQDLIDVTLDYI